MAEPVNRRDKPGGSGKYYIHPLKEGVRFDSVTTILDTVDKAALKIWAGQLSAAYAVEHLPEITASLMVEECGKHTIAKERCTRCTPCVQIRIANQHWFESHRRAEEGTETHEAIQFWIHNKGVMPKVREEVQPFVDQFFRFVKEYGLTWESWEQTEGTVINYDHG
jgi:hypothetical protein